jgi:general secretion pathway protein I
MTRDVAAPRRHTGERGFSLLEVLVALVIAGIALSAVFSATTETLRATTAAFRTQEAVSRARSRLDAAAVSLAVGEQEGDDGGGFHWRTQISLVGTTGKRDATGKTLRSDDMLVVSLHAITVWISWNERTLARTVRLDSARLLTSAPG